MCYSAISRKPLELFTERSHNVPLSTTNAQLREVIREWLECEDPDFGWLNIALNAVWDHVTNFLEQPVAPAQSSQSRQVFHKINQAMLSHSQACAHLETALAKDNVETCWEILALLERGDRLLAEAEREISAFRSATGFEA